MDTIKMKTLKTLLSLTVIFIMCSCNKQNIIQNESLTVTKAPDKYIITFSTKYCFGDQVEFASPVNGSGKGTILFIDISDDGHSTYGIEMEDGTAQGGIEDKEIKLIKGKNP
jgi:hypothetical protein